MRKECHYCNQEFVVYVDFFIHVIEREGSVHAILNNNLTVGHNHIQIE